ncbi:zinc finger BED domain-containing protein DAYSLEEPER-like [Apium graveolens]|uniref:zinc finger BED domain-containing protein DAYSLEEPER-like n=1 Tax=Apium graveolens TaxID=4045 RepID=UPI003D7BBD0C
MQSLISNEIQDEGSILYQTAFEMNEKFRKYWKNYSLILSFAVILDPRYKLKFVEYVFRKIYPTNYSEKVRQIYEKMEELYLDYYRISNISSTSITFCPRVTNEDHDEEMDDIDEFESIFCQNDSQNETKSQLHLYLEESKLDARVKLDVLSFWRSNKSKYPILSAMTRDILSMPITTVASESSFSIGS